MIRKIESSFDLYVCEKIEVIEFILAVISNYKFESLVLNDLTLDINEAIIMETINKNDLFSIKLIRSIEDVSISFYYNYERLFSTNYSSDNYNADTVLFIIKCFSKYLKGGWVEESKFSGWNMSLEPSFWEYKKRPIFNPLPVIPLPSPLYPDYKQYSKEHIPNHTHRMNINEQLTFTAAWQMYFGKVYYKFIPKPLFDDFKDCEENVILAYGVRRITLYKNPDDFLQPENIRRMWSFRRQLGIDSIAHELTFDKNRIEPENLPVLITKQNCAKGQTKVTRFLDKNYQLINSDKAVYKEIKEYLDDGITVVYEEKVNL